MKGEIYKLRGGLEKVGGRDVSELNYKDREDLNILLRGNTLNKSSTRGKPRLSAAYTVFLF